ncbi:MAG: LPP20 family lipoprotein [Muribaculum sp.]|nr:LPP20 family lipoprotein [Muribaculum sp.]
MKLSQYSFEESHITDKHYSNRIRRTVTKAILLLAFLLPLTTMAAKKETAEQKQANEIMAKPDAYIYGVGYANDPEEAYNAALHDMVRKISVSVKGSTHTESTEGFTADGSDLSSERFKSVIDSYTNVSSLEGVQVINLKSGPEFERFVYMPRANIEKMYQRRIKKVADLARNGIKARKNRQVDDALRYLYRSYVLLQSLPSPSEVVEYVDDENRNLLSWIPTAMADIISRVKFGIATVEKDVTNPDNPKQNVEVTVKYDGEPVTSCTFKYGTSFGYSSQITARDGMAFIDIDSSVPMNPLKLYVEYLFKDENHNDPELRPMLDSFKGSGLVHNDFALNTKPNVLKADKKEAKVFQQAVAAGAHEGIAALDNIDAAPYANVMEEVLSAIRNRDYSGIDRHFTDDGRKIFDRMIRYGKVRILGKAGPDTYSFYPFRNEVVCRSVPMSFTFSGGRKFTEDVTFTFNSEHKIEGLAFGLGSIARRDIFAKEGSAWTDDKKMVIVNFLENYRTAFALKEQDYIESIFDDNAVIIVGHVTKRLEKVTGGGDAVGFASKEQVTYAEKSKREYMEQLRRCFASQEFINVRFTDTDVERSGVGGDTYAIQLKQDYVSQTYGDQGYLFLFIDFNDADRPQIHIRTWQPERSPDLTPNLPPDHPRFGIFSPASF